MSSDKEWLQERGVKHQEVELIERARNRKLWHDMIERERERGERGERGERERQHHCISCRET